MKQPDATGVQAVAAVSLRGGPLRAGTIQRRELVMSLARVSVCACLMSAAAAGCGAEAGQDAGRVSLPATGSAFRALGEERRSAVAEACRERAAALADGLAERELHAIDVEALRERLDAAYTVIAEQRRPVAAICRREIPFVTPGLKLQFDGARDDRHGSFSVQTRSDKRLQLRGRVTPLPIRGRVHARREVGRAVRVSAPVDSTGRFALPAVGLRKVADNTFTVTIRVPPHATRKVVFTAICLDCLAGGVPPTAER
jgi:hypothetical protein